MSAHCCSNAIKKPLSTLSVQFADSTHLVFLGCIVGEIQDTIGFICIEMYVASLELIYATMKNENDELSPGIP